MEQQIGLGTQVYNRGDVCNPSHFGIITAIRITKWGTDVQILALDSEIRPHPYWVPMIGISHVDSGNGSTRIVTLEAYEARREQEIAEARRQWEAIEARRAS